MGFRIKSSRHPESRWYPHNDELKGMLNLPDGHKYDRDSRLEACLPGSMNGEDVMVRLVLLPFDEAKVMHPRSSKPRRLHAECPSCKRLVCAGHTTQHKC